MKFYLRNYILFFLISVGPASTCFGRYLSLATQFPETKEMILEFKTEDFLIFRDSEDSTAISVHQIEKLPNESFDSFSEVLKARANFFDLMGLQKQTEIKSSELDGHPIHLIRSDYEFQSVYSVEVWQDYKDSFEVITASFTTLESAEQKYKSLLEHKSTSAWRILFNKAEAAESSTAKKAQSQTEVNPSRVIQTTHKDVVEKCNRSSGPNLFQEPVREIMESVKESLDVACHTPDPKPMSAANIAAEASLACLKGVAASPTELIKFAYEILNFAFKGVFNSKYRSSVMSGLGGVAFSIIQDPTGFVAQLFSSIWEAAAKELKQFRDCSNFYRIRVTCRLMMDMATGNLILKAKKALKGTAIVADTVTETTTLAKAAKTNLGETKAPSTKAVREQLSDSITSPGSGSSSERLAKNSKAVEAYQKRLSNMRAAESEIEVLNAESRAVHREIDSLGLDPDFDEIPAHLHDKLSTIQSRLEKARGDFKKNEAQSLRDLQSSLKQKGIESKVVSSGGRSDKTFSYLNEMIDLNKRLARREQKLKEMKAMGAPSVLTYDAEKSIKKLKALLEKNEKDLAGKSEYQNAKKLFEEYKAGSLDDQHDFMASLAQMTTPHLEITALPNTKVVQSINEKLQSRVIVSPTKELSSTRTLNGSFTDADALSHIRLSGATILNFEDLSHSTTLLHEARHAHFAKQRKLGRETPYNVQLSALDDKPLMDASPTYRKYFSFEELSAWDRDANFAKRTNRTENLEMRNKQVKLFIHESERALLRADLELRKKIPLTATEESANHYSVTIPLNYQNKKRQLRIVLTGKPPADPAALNEAVSGYLTRVKAAITAHKEKVYAGSSNNEAFADSIFSSRSSTQKLMEEFFKGMPSD